MELGSLDPPKLPITNIQGDRRSNSNVTSYRLQRGGSIERLVVGKGLARIHGSSRSCVELFAILVRAEDVVVCPVLH